MENVTCEYFDKKGKPCGKENAVLCVIRYLDAQGNVISEDEVEIVDDDE